MIFFDIILIIGFYVIRGYFFSQVRKKKTKVMLVTWGFHTATGHMRRICHENISNIIISEVMSSERSP